MPFGWEAFAKANNQLHPDGEKIVNGFLELCRQIRDAMAYIGETKGKPDPEVFLRCADALGIPVSKYSETFVIEDSYNGIRAAYAAGMKPVMVPDQLPPTQEMREKAVAVLPSLTEAAEWLRVS